MDILFNPAKVTGDQQMRRLVMRSIEKKLAVLQALVGVNIALTSGVLWLAFKVVGRLPR